MSPVGKYWKIVWVLHWLAVTENGWYGSMAENPWKMGDMVRWLCIHKIGFEWVPGWEYLEDGRW
jgi:hypothetical protein